MLKWHIMATYDTGNWRELFDVALFEPNRVKLRQTCISLVLAFDAV
jgi:hypothetical protein